MLSALVRRRLASRLLWALLAAVLALPALPAPALARAPRGGAETAAARRDDARPGRPRDIASRRSATSRTVDNGDGTLTTSLYSSPIHYRARGRWAEIDSSIVASDAEGYAYRNAANEFDLHFKDRLDDGYLRFARRGSAFDFSLDDAAPSDARTGARSVAYPDVFPGVDLRYDVVPEGAKETLVLAHENVRNEFRFTVDAPSKGVRAGRLDDGSWAFYAGPLAEPAFVIGDPYVLEDGREPSADGARSASVSVDEVDGGYAVTLRVERDWLEAPGRSFPVRLDPTITIQPSVEDASYPATCGGCTPFVSDRLYVGTDDSNAWRAALQFDLSSVPAGSAVTDARLKLNFDGYCISATGPFCGGTSHQVDAHRMNKAWSTSTTTSQLGFDAAPLSSFTLPGGASAQWMSWNLTSTVKAWLDGTQPNHGVLLKRATEPLSISGPVPPGKRFTEPSVRPKLEVTYTSDAVELLEPDILHSDGADLEWTRYTGPSGAPFEKYDVHRSPTPGFAPSASTLLTTIRDASVTAYRDTTAAPNKSFTYKVVANSSASNERTVTLPADGRATMSLQPDGTAGRATYLYYATTLTNCANYGADPLMWAGSSSTARWRPILAFDLRDVPAGAAVSNAKLSLWHTYGVNRSITVNAHRVTSAWQEGIGRTQCTGGATWYDADSGVRWASQGGDFDATASASVTNPAGEAPGWDDWDVTSLVQSWARGTHPNLGVILKAADESLVDGNDVVYNSDDHSVTPTLRPKLTVTYEDGSHARGPTVAVAAPGGGQTVSGAGVTITATASDDRRVDRVEFLVDGTQVGADTSAPFSTTWNSTSVANGAHVISARATDDAGNTSTSSGTTVTVENSAPPTTSITSPAGGSVAGTVAIAANAADDRGVTKVEFLVDNDLVATDTTVPYGASWNTLDAEQTAFDGTHVLTTRAYDDGGQSTASAPVTVTVANTANTKYQVPITTTTLPQAVTYDPALTTQELHGVDVTITNNGTVTLSGTDTVVNYRWYSPDAPSVVTAGPGVALGSDLRRGRSVTKRLLIAPPVLADGVDRAQYRLRIDLQEKSTGTWFSAKGNRPVENPIIVNKALKTALGLERYYHYTGEPVGAGMTHLANVANGNSLLRWTPFMTPGRGLATVVDLNYNSLEKKSDSPVGSNFSMSISSLTRLGLPLDIHPNKADEIAGRSNRFVDLTDGDGTTHRFIGKQAADGTVYWEEPPGVHLYLRSTADPVKKWALTRPDRTTFYYDPDGFPVSVEDRNGNTISFTYEDTPPGDDPGGPKKRIVKVVDAAGQGTSPAPKRAFSIDYYSKDEVKKAHVRGNVQSITDHEGHALAFDYYDDGNLLRLTQRGGTKADGSHLADRSFVFSYTTSDGSGPAIADAAQRKSPDPKTPNQSTRLFGVVDPRGNETTFTYYGPGSSQDRWKLKSITNRGSETTSYAYDLLNRVTTVTAPLARVTKYDYDTEGKVVKLTNPKNEVTQVAWTADRHVSKVTEPTGKFTEYQYNDNGYVTKVWDQLRNLTELTYQNVAVDGNDVSGKWKTGRTIPHVSQLVAKTDPKGTATTVSGDYQWSFTYDAKGNMDSARDPESAVTRFAYNADGTVASVTDANSHTTTYPTYDPSGQPTKVVDAKGRTTTLGYDADGLLLWIQDALHAGASGGNPRHYRTYLDYDSFHRLGRQSAPKSTKHAPGELVWSAADFDANDNVVTQIAPHYGAEYTGAGSKTRVEYDAMDRQTLVTEPDVSADSAGERTAFSYDGAGRLARVTLPRGVQSAVNGDFTVTFDYDALDRVIKQTRVAVDGAGAVTEARKTHMCYDLAGDLVSVTKPRANVDSVNCALPPAFTTRYGYDAAHRATSITDPLSNRRSFTYDANGNVDTQTNANGDATTIEYDQRNKPVKLVQPFDPATGRKVTTMFRYDGVGNRTKLISPRAYDASPDKQTFTQFVTTFVYDEVNQLVRVDLPTSNAAPEQHYVHRAYDPNGNLEMTSLAVKAADPSTLTPKQKTSMTLFDTGWIRTSDDPGNPRVHYDYFAEGWQKSRVPEKATGGLDDDEKMLWQYYPDGLPSEVRDVDGQATTYEYDANDNLTVAKDASGVTSTKESRVDVEAAYNGFDEVLETRTKKATETNWKSTTYSYDLNGNVTQRVEDAEETGAGALVKEGRKHDLTYDGADWLDVQVDHGTKPADTTDDQKIDNAFYPTGWERDRVVYKSNGTGGWTEKQRTSWEFFANGKLKRLTTKNATGAIVEQHLVSYEDAGIYVNGHRTRDEFILKGPGSTACVTTACVARYEYDPRDRLIRYDNGHGGTTTYQLDPAGNVLQEAETGKPTRSFTYEGNQLQTITVGTATAEYWYDNDANLDCVTLQAGSQSNCNTPTGQSPSGNLVSDYAYDDLNRLVKYQSYGSTGVDDTANYTYDALDRVTEQEETHSGGTSPKKTLFNYVGLTNLVSKEEEKGSAGSLLNTKTYSYDAYGHRISMTEAPTGATPQTYTYGYDVHGSVSLLLKETGEAKASYAYTPYGAEDSALSKGDQNADNPVNAYRYSARRLDSGSGSIDMGARRFGPDAMRFLQQDVFYGALSNLALSIDPLTQNRYALAGGNPVSFVEFDGHMLIPDGGGGSVSDPNPSKETSTIQKEGSGDSDSSYPSYYYYYDYYRRYGDSGDSATEARSYWWDSVDWDRVREYSTAAANTFNTLHGAYMGARARTSGIARALRAGSSEAARQLPTAGRLTALARNPWFRRAGPIGTLASGALSAADYIDQGKPVGEALGRAGAETAGGFLGGAAVGAACAAAGVVSLGVGLAACAVGAVVVGDVGARIGKEVGDIVFSGESLGDAVGDFFGSYEEDFEGIADTVGGAIDAINPFD